MLSFWVCKVINYCGANIFVEEYEGNEGSDDWIGTFGFVQYSGPRN